MTQRSVSFAPTALFVKHFPKEVQEQTKQFMQETWQQDRRIKQFVAEVSTPEEPATKTPEQKETCENAHPKLEPLPSKSYSEREMRSAFYVGFAFGGATALLFLWLHGGGN